MDVAQRALRAVQAPHHIPDELQPGQRWTHEQHLDLDLGAPELAPDADMGLAGFRLIADLHASFVFVGWSEVGGAKTLLLDSTVELGGTIVASFDDGDTQARAVTLDVRGCTHMDDRANLAYQVVDMRMVMASEEDVDARIHIKQVTADADLIGSPGVCAEGYLLNEDGSCGRWRSPFQTRTPRASGTVHVMSDRILVMHGGVDPDQMDAFLEVQQPFYDRIHEAQTDAERREIFSEIPDPPPECAVELIDLESGEVAGVRLPRATHHYDLFPVDDSRFAVIGSMTGFKDPSTPYVAIYDTGSGEWTPLPDLPTTNPRCRGTTLEGERLYATCAAEDQSWAWSFDGEAWNEQPIDLVVIEFLDAAAGEQALARVRWDQPGLASLDPRTHAWTRLTEMPRDASVLVEDDGDLLFYGGSYTEKALTRFDPRTGQSEVLLTDAPAPSFFQLLELNGSVYLAAGYDGWMRLDAQEPAWVPLATPRELRRSSLPGAAETHWLLLEDDDDTATLTTLLVEPECAGARRGLTQYALMGDEILPIAEVCPDDLDPGRPATPGDGGGDGPWMSVELDGGTLVVTHHPFEEQGMQWRPDGDDPHHPVTIAHEPMATAPTEEIRQAVTYMALDHPEVLEATALLPLGESAVLVVETAYEGWDFTSYDDSASWEFDPSTATVTFRHYLDVGLEDLARTPDGRWVAIQEHADDLAAHFAWDGRGKRWIRLPNTDQRELAHYVSIHPDNLVNSDGSAWPSWLVKPSRMWQSPFFSWEVLELRAHCQSGEGISCFQAVYPAPMGPSLLHHGPPLEPQRLTAQGETAPYWIDRGRTQMAVRYGYCDPLVPASCESDDMRRWGRVGKRSGDAVEVLRERDRAEDAGDLDAVVAFYAEDAIIEEADRRRRGGGSRADTRLRGGGHGGRPGRRIDGHPLEDRSRGRRDGLPAGPGFSRLPRVLRHRPPRDTARSDPANHLGGSQPPPVSVVLVRSAVELLHRTVHQARCTGTPMARVAMNLSSAITPLDSGTTNWRKLTAASSESAIQTGTAPRVPT